ncbi:hypothetical protein G5I_02596 [Acromyrmex echinatior]|uniref:Uncharacterized protein n=1 Tax=Acromyrmex echinatior TaxID=103372 RepID=F4WAQ7_ACREC|nr:hypothetical protein G5I_02596 [Acromyrmex echinatior]
MQTLSMTSYTLAFERAPLFGNLPLSIHLSVFDPFGLYGADSWLCCVDKASLEAPTPTPAPKNPKQRDQGAKRIGNSRMHCQIPSINHSILCLSHKSHSVFTAPTRDCVVSKKLLHELDRAVWKLFKYKYTLQKGSLLPLLVSVELMFSKRDDTSDHDRLRTREDRAANTMCAPHKSHSIFRLVAMLCGNVLPKQLLLVGSNPQSEANMPPHPQKYMPQLPSISEAAPKMAMEKSSSACRAFLQE